MSESDDADNGSFTKNASHYYADCEDNSINHVTYKECGIYRVPEGEESSEYGPASFSFTVEDEISLLDASLEIEGEDPVVAYQGNNLDIVDGEGDVSAILTTQGQTQLITVVAGSIETTTYQEETVEAPIHATLTLEFDDSVFTDWLYNAETYAEILSTADSLSCSINYTSTASVSDGDGCVNGFTAGGKICGTDIPVDPFTMLEDRGSTDLNVSLECDFLGSETEDGDEAFTELGGSCQALSENPACTFTSRECMDELDSGACLTYSNTYTCSEELTYDTDTVQNINLCNSDLSCMGDDCVPDTSTDGSLSFAETASKLSAVDMILTDMECEIDETGVTAEDDLNSCEIFKGDSQKCKKVVLGLANCCSSADGVSMADYLQMAFAVSRVSRIVEGSSLANPVTSAWVSMEDFARDSFSELTRPITETWESIIGNSGIAKEGAEALSMEAIKQNMMKNAAQWVADIFGEQAANAIFQVSGGSAVVGGQVQAGTIGLTQGAATVMNAVMTAYTIYTLASMIINILFACSEGEQELAVRRALKSTHYVGEYCSNRVLGNCLQRKKTYCMFNSPLARIMNEQARAQLGIGWGSAKSPNCQGITVEQFQSLDMDQVDLSEWTGILATNGMLETSSYDLESLTGSGSTLAEAQEDMYEREDAVTRNVNRMDEVDLDALRQDAIDDFGMGTVE
jgi:conjugal transfer mating pair stabilization protein TraN